MTKRTKVRDKWFVIALSEDGDVELYGTFKSYDRAMKMGDKQFGEGETVWFVRQMSWNWGKEKE